MKLASIKNLSNIFPTMTCKQNKIVYITGNNLLKQCDKLSVIENRSSMVHELIKSYGLLNYLTVMQSTPCTKEDLLIFHSEDYVKYLIDNNDNYTEDVTEEQLGFGLGYDCPLIENIYNFVTAIVGGTLSAVEELLNGTEIAINWNGGWHHAQRDEAEGFCYVNDIVIGIQKLRTKFKKILYIDLDVHHGNGVENAFSFSKNIFTLSFHQREPGYFPGSGDYTEIGFGAGRGFTVNAPFQRNISGELYIPYFKRISGLVYEAFSPEAIVIQCGGDVITGDKLGGTNLVPNELKKCILFILGWKTAPKLFLGGGGYNLANTSKYWTELTALICGRKIPNDIPDNDYFLSYGPDYSIDVYHRNVEDLNMKEELKKVISTVEDNLFKFVRKK